MFGIRRSLLVFPYGMLLGWISTIEGLTQVLTLGLFTPAWTLSYALWLAHRARQGKRVYREMDESYLKTILMMED